MRKILKDWFTAPGNEHYEAGRFLWFISVLALLGYTGWHLYQNGVFDVVEFGVAAASLIAAGGWGVGAKDVASAKARAA